MKVSELFTGFLEAEDLPEGRDIEVVIEEVRRAGAKDLGRDGRPIDKPIVRLAKVKKEWVLNKTNARAIRRLYGNETDNWHGKPVTIYRTTCSAFGDPQTPCIRVRTATL
jgi:hypothetical protein